MINLIEFIEKFKETEIPLTHVNFETEHILPFAAYTSDYLEIFADGKRIFEVNNISLELYTEKHDILSILRVEKVLSDNKISFSKEQVWIEKEYMLQTVYDFSLKKKKR